MKPQSFVIALIVISTALLIELVAERTSSGALPDLLVWVSFWSYIPFGLATGSAATNSRALLITLSIAVVVIVAPRGMEALSHALAPVGTGVLLGNALRRSVGEPHGQPS